jgi:tetratricopeptide (TPR) repeat protein
MTATPAKLSVSQLTLYNPSRLKDAEINAAFVVRKALFERVLGDIAAEKPNSRAQHHLIVGQRGMGKSMLLARLASELRINPELSKHFVPLVFAEEQYAVDRLSKFWLNCLDALADAAERAGETAVSQHIDAVVRTLEPQLGGTGEKDEALARAALDAFLQATESVGKRPVLLVDNLQMVFDRIANVQQHALREVLMRPGSPILVGASPSPPSQSQDYGAAFFDHFKNHYLRALSADEMRDLVLKLAERTGRTDVRDKVLAYPQRLKALRDLTGGNPRTVVTLFLLFAEDFSTSVVADLDNLLDRVTPLYKARLEELSDQQQVIISAIADLWKPVTAGLVSETIGLPTTSISGQLDRLEKIGWVEKIEIFRETSGGFQIAERFFNVWFLMRSASRRRRREVEFLVRFIEAFYEAKYRPRLAQHLMNERDLSPGHYQLAKALAHTLATNENEELARHADLDILRQKKAAESRRRLEEVIDFSTLPAATLAFNELREKLTALVPEDAGVTPEQFAEEVLGDRQMFIRGEWERLAATSGKLCQEKIATILKSVSDATELDESKYGKSSVTWFRQRLACGQLRSLFDTDDWNRSFLKVNERSAIQLLVDSIPQRIVSELSQEAHARIREALAPSPDSAALAWNDWGVDLHRKLGWYPESEAAYRRAIEIDPRYADPWDNLGDLLQDHLGRYTEAEEAYRKAIEIDPKFTYPWNGLGNLLSYHLGRYAEAEEAYRKAIEIDPKLAYPWDNLGDLLQFHLGRYAEAEEAFRNAIEIDPKLADPWNGLGDLYCDHLQRYSDAASAFKKALEYGWEESPRLNLVFLYRDFLGDMSAAREAFAPLQAKEAREWQDSFHLHEALFAAYDSNWGLCTEALAKAMKAIGHQYPSSTEDDWCRASAVLLHLNYGEELLAFLRERGDDGRLRPWYEALAALQREDRRYLQNIPVEVRTTAEYYFDQIEKRLKSLPEKTRRRPVPKPAKKRRRP